MYESLMTHVAAPVVADEEDGAAALVVGGLFTILVPATRSVIVVAVVVDGAAVAAAGRAGLGGLAPVPTARLLSKRLLRMVHDTPMLEMAPPFEQALRLGLGPPKVLWTTYTGRPSNCANPGSPRRRRPARSTRSVAEEARVDDLEPAAADEDGAAAVLRLAAVELPCGR